jgi:hypothetical protein
MAGHSNAKTTGLYDRRNDDISVGEVERIISGCYIIFDIRRRYLRENVPPRTLI